MTTYALRYPRNSDRNSTLVELTREQIAALNDDDMLTDDRYDYGRLSTPAARRWVLRGFPHETYLYVDQGRIRRATDA